MSKFAKMAALLMSAVMCVFTSCGEDSDKKDKDVTSTPEITAALLVTPEVRDVVDGTLTFEFKPSGKSTTLRFSDATGAFDAETDKILAMVSGLASYTNYIAKAGCVKCNLKGNANDTQVVITPNLKVKEGVELSADKRYTYEFLVPYDAVMRGGGHHAGLFSLPSASLPGDKFADYCESSSIPHTIDL